MPSTQGGHSALYLSPWELPPVVERLINLIEILSECGITMLVIDWGGLFPWSLDERFLADVALPDEAVVAFFAKAKSLGLSCVSCIPVGRDMQAFLGVPAYRYLGKREGKRFVLDPGAPGAVKFVCDLVDDMQSLVPEMSRIYFDLPAELLPTAAGVGTALFAEMRERDLQVLAPKDLYIRGSSENRTAAGIPIDVYTDPGQKVPVGTMWRLCDLPGWSYSLPPTVELYLGEIQSIGKGEIGHGAGETAPIMKRAEYFAGSVGRCWCTVRQVRESFVLVCRDPGSIQRGLYNVRWALDEIERLLIDLTESGADLSEAARGFVVPAKIECWIASRIEPLREEYAVLSSRFRQYEIAGRKS